MRKLIILLTLLLAVTLQAENVHSFTVNNIQDEEFKLADLKGKIFLIVNVASKCGLTPQYKDLQAIYQKYKNQGFEILAFPANNFGKQEPGSNSEILQFCQSKYNVTFKMMSKIDVRNSQEKLYKYLTTHPKFGGKIKWNFEKFLVDANGEVIARFPPKVKPQSQPVISAIEAALAKAK